MADSIQLDLGIGGPQVATDEIAGRHFQRQKMTFGVDGVALDVNSENPLPMVISPDGDQRVPLFRYLDTVGDGSGSKNMAVDGTTPVVFKIKPPPGVIYRIRRAMIYIEDAGTLTATGYGAGATLTNGISIEIHDGTSQILDLCDGLDVMQNSHWPRLCYDASPIDWGTGANVMASRWTFAKAGVILRLDGDQTEELRVTVNDNISGIDDHTFKIDGYIEGVNQW